MKKFYLSSVMAFGALPLLAANATDNELSQLIANAADGVVNLDAKVEYTLDTTAVCEPLKVVTIKGNGATIKVGAKGQFVAQKGIVIDNAVIDASAATLNLVQLEYDVNKIDSTLATFAKNAETGVLESKYTGGSQNMMEAERVAILNSTIKNLPQGLISGNKYKWAIDTLVLQNNIINFNTTAINDPAGYQAAIDLAAFQHIALKNNTIYNTAANTGSYFFRLTNASNAQPQKVWGKNAEGNDFTTSVDFENNTFVNALGTKDFANNFVSKNLVTFSLKNNVFYNVFRFNNKMVGGCTVADKEATIACNIFDHSEGYTLDGNETKTATLQETGIVAPTAETGFEVEALGACFGLYKELAAFGDPRWAAYNSKENTGIVNLETAEQINDTRKVMINGQLMIIRNGRSYNAAGVQMK